MKIIKSQINSLFIFALAITLTFNLGCEVDSEQTLPDRNWQLVWSDEFNGTNGTAPDSTKWNYNIGNGQDGWGNQELQYYTDRTENISMDGTGNLVITARKELFSGAPFTSARINTKGLFSQQYGRFEARMKTPYGPGLWPAFWLLGSNIDEVSWPQCGEIDIMELRGQIPNVINGSIHGPGYSGGNPVSKGFTLSNDRFDTEYHIFAVEWGEDFIDFFVDNTLYQRITPDDVPGEWVYDNDFFIILNVAVGGSYVGFPVNDTPFPQQMIVDYVRGYQ